ncbi:hypothetical protein BOX15_Mlig011433g2 [Macrostomum lignano]|uniref:TRPM SLOG domain-containing protein n=1 Tax=Macrostomum lignano TaxID=282301 RepID=A0A267EQP3_9PLAT|nr:hypothetical protein BOX15_Mlig011433g2 [Macrostomum lignano]
MEDAELYQDCLSGAPSTVLTESVSSSSRSSSNDKWIERNISKLECVRFTPVAADLAKCQCGKPLSEHPHGLPRSTTAWASASHTEASPTDAYGVIEFVSGPHPTRAHYIRVAANTQPEQLLHILTRVWRLRLPKLVLTVHGGIQNFELQPKLKKVVLNGILKAAKTTDAWVISTGLDNGISRYVGESISEEIHMKKHRIAAIGIAPWGVIRDREQLIGRNRTCKYFAISSSSKALSVLNRCHNYFILVDDGQSNVYGTEIQLRRAFERHLCSMRLDKSRFGVGLDRVPVVATLIEGGANVFRHVLDLTLDRRPIPVVVCDGSGRAADILAFIHKNGEQVLNCPALADQIVDLIRDKFRLARSKALAVFSEIRVCLQGPGRDLVSVFRLGEGRFKDVDDAILTSLLSSHHLSHSSQLKLTMAWNRVDLARSHLFQYGQDWRSADLERAMMEALMNNRIEFVKLLLEWGVNVERFLTRLRLEDLYTFCLFGDETKGLGKYLRFLLKQTLARFSKKQQRVSLYLIGRLVQELIGGGFVHEYTRRFCLAKAAVRSASGALPPDAAAGATGGLASEQPTITGAASNTLMNSIKSVRSMLRLGAGAPSGGAGPSEIAGGGGGMGYSNSTHALLLNNQQQQQVPQQPQHEQQQHRGQNDYEFRFPYTDLMTWAVLCRRYELAWYFMQCGEDVIAKALFSAALFRAIMTRIDEDVHVEYYQELESWCDKYEAEALSMLEHCYKFDPRLTRKLVTYQLAEFGGHTCMSLAYTSRSMLFLNHACPQIILNDLWYGGVRETDDLTGLRVFALCLVLLACPPLFFTLLLFTNFVEFKSLQELRDQPQTRDEFGDVESSSSSSSSSGSSVSSRDAEAKAHRVEQQADQHQASAAAGAAPASSLRNFMRQVPEESLSDKIDRLGLQSGGSGQANAKKSGGRVNFVNELPMTTIVGPQAQQHAGKTAQLPRIGSSGGGRAGASSSLHFPMKDSEYSGYQNYHTRGPQPQPQHSRLDRLPYRMRVSEFFSAPITRYWIHLITYAIFIVSFFSYVLVVLPESRFVWQEYLVFAYIVSYALDKVREISNCNGLTLRVKLQVHLSDLWNIYDLCICAFSLVGIALRVASVHSVNGAAADNSSFVGFYTNYSLLLLGNGSGLGDAHSEFARQFYVFFCSHNIMVISLALWLLRIFEVLINWKHLGPYLYMVATMISKMLPPVVIIFIPLCAFGIVRQGIQYPQYNTFNITVLKGVLLKPYFMLYGEVYAGEIDPDEWTGLESLMPLRCVVPIAMVIFLLVAVIVCISIIIAVFNDVYHEVHEKSKQVYKYLRFSIIIEYESMPMFPPPLTLVSWIFLTVRWLYHKRCRFWGCGGGGGGGGGGGVSAAESTIAGDGEENRVHLITSLKLFLKQDEIEDLQDFEEECVQDFLLSQTRAQREKLDHRIAATNQLAENTALRLEDMIQRQSVIKQMLQVVDQRICTGGPGGCGSNATATAAAAAAAAAAVATASPPAAAAAAAEPGGGANGVAEAMLERLAEADVPGNESVSAAVAAAAAAAATSAAAAVASAGNPNGSGISSRLGGSGRQRFNSSRHRHLSRQRSLSLTESKHRQQQQASRRSPHVSGGSTGGGAASVTLSEEAAAGATSLTQPDTPDVTMPDQTTPLLDTGYGISGGGGGGSSSQMLRLLSATNAPEEYTSICDGIEVPLPITEPPSPPSPASVGVQQPVDTANAGGSGGGAAGGAVEAMDIGDRSSLADVEPRGNGVGIAFSDVGAAGQTLEAMLRNAEEAERLAMGPALKRRLRQLSCTGAAESAPAPDVDDLSLAAATAPVGGLDSAGVTASESLINIVEEVMEHLTDVASGVGEDVEELEERHRVDDSEDADSSDGGPLMIRPPSSLKDAEPGGSL